ncbi:MAG: GNAT family N-acetyltransferase [Bryobacterales bacterium]|nr:GNAT family N-acetyltransferase [Bryobacterales bacterium]
MTFADLSLARRLEPAEGYASAEFVDARRSLQPGCGSEWIRCAGTIAVYDGPESPITQTFGLGVFETATPETMAVLERFFVDRAAPIMHEVSPLAGVATINLLCERGYRAAEISNVMYQAVAAESGEPPGPITVRAVTGPDIGLWTDVCVRGWAHELPGAVDFLRRTGQIIANRPNSVCFLAEWNGTPGASGSLCLHDGVALFAGSSTVPELRRRGLQAALLRTRMQYAADHGCDLAMMVAEAGSQSQRNAERRGFRVAYTRTKWRLG